MLVYFFYIYRWSDKVLAHLDGWFKKFIWNGDILIRKFCIVAWTIVCRPVDQGGLELKSSKQINNALIFKLTWDFMTLKKEWVIICISRYT